MRKSASAGVVLVTILAGCRSIQDLSLELRYGDRKARHAAERLVAAGPKAVPCLVDALRAGDQEARSWAWIALGRIGEPAAKPVAAALRDESPEVRASAAKALGMMKAHAREAVADLVAALADASGEVRREACQALAAIGAQAQSAVPALIESLRSDGDGRVRSAAATGLGGVAPGDERALRALVTAMRDDPVARESALGGLGMWGPKAEGAVGDIARILASDPTARIRRIATHVLCRIAARPDVALPALIDAFGDEGKDVAHGAIQSAVEFGRSAVPFLVDAVRRREGATKLSAIRALGRIGSDAGDAAAVLAECLAPGSRGEVKIEAMGALAGIGHVPEPAVPSVVAVLRDWRELPWPRSGFVLSDAERCWRAVVPRLGASLAPALAEIVASGTRDEREWAVRALGDAGPSARAAAPALIRAIRDEERWVGDQAIIALGRIGAGEAVPALIAALRDGDGPRQEWAVRALGRIGPRASAAVPALRRLARDRKRTGAGSAARDAIFRIRRGR